MKYQVVFYCNNEYEVLELIREDEWTSVFKGLLSECEAWIRLHEQGYM